MNLFGRTKRDKTASYPKKHLSRDTDYCLCSTEGVKPQDLVHTMKEWKEIPPSHQCRRCIKEKEMVKRGKYDDLY
jgi:hypothetical protein